MDININAIIVLVALVILFGIILVSGRKIKEYAVYYIDGEVDHLWRKQQNVWFEWGNEMVFYRQDGASRIILEKHYVKKYQELKSGEWEKIAEENKVVQ
jgi:hypothetical protein